MWQPAKAPTMPPSAPRIAPRPGLTLLAAVKAAPLRAPKMILATRPSGAVRGGVQEGQEGTTEADPVELDAPGDDRRSGEGAKAGDDTDEESGEENVVGEHGGKDCATGRERLSTQGNPHSRRKSGIWTAGKRHSPYFCWGMRDM